MLKWMAATKGPDPVDSGPIHRLTEDPLATLNIGTKDYKRSKLSMSSSGSKRKKQEDIYSVTRMNPLFQEENPLETTEMTQSHPHRRPKSLSDDGSSSSFENPSSSSGYESVATAEKFRVPDVSNPPQNDYRRRFAMQDKNSGLQNSRIGHSGSLIRCNPQFVSHIQIRKGWKNSARQMLPRLPENESGWDLTDSQPYAYHRPIIPEPIWPMKTRAVSTGGRTLPHPVIPYIQGISNADADMTTGQSKEPGDSLIVWAADIDEWDSLPHNYPELKPPVEESIGQLSQTISRSHTLRMVSRALNNQSSINRSYNGFIHQRISPTITASSASMNRKNRWKTLIFDSPVVDPVLRYQTLNHEYVPRNGDLNFQSSTLGSRNTKTFSTSADVRVVKVTEVGKRQLGAPFRMNQLHFETDSLRSSSRSSSSSARRVTFSADTVDNEPSIRSSISSIASYSELKLNPQDLIQKNSPTADPAGYYTYKIYVNGNDSQNQLLNQSRMELHKTQKQETIRDQSRLSTNHPTLEEGGNLLLHPNYGAACPNLNGLCMDFTLDGPTMNLLHQKSVNEKQRKRLCCGALMILCLAFFIFFCIAISLYLTQGQKFFGPI